MMMIFFVMGAYCSGCISRSSSCADFSGCSGCDCPADYPNAVAMGITAIGAMVSLQIGYLGGCTFQWPSPRRKLARLGPKDAIASGSAE